MKTLLGIAAVVMGVGMAGCIDLSSKSEEAPTTRMPPIGDFTSPSAGFKSVASCTSSAPVIIYRAILTCPAWLHFSSVCSNRLELTLQGNYPTMFPDPANPFAMVLGQDYDVCPVESLVLGIPSTAHAVIVESNHRGSGTAADYQRSPAAQANLQAFAQAGNTVVIHMAGNAPSGWGYLAPGAFGPVSEDGDSNTMNVGAPDTGLVRGPDKMLGTGDDVTNTSIAWIGGASAHQGSLSGILPGDAEVQLTGDSGKPIYAEYPFGDGRFIISSVTFEFGEDYGFMFPGTGFGHTDRLMFNHLFAILNRFDPDDDEDGAPRSRDCDDHNPRIQELLFKDGFDSDSGFFRTTDQLSGDPWAYINSQVMATGASQQALVGVAQDWTDVVVQATVSSGGTYGGCCIYGPTHRWRAGIVARTSLDGDQDEGFHGFRCGLGSNAQPLDGVPHSGDSTGQFLQIGQFMDAEEDNISSECEGGLNTTFDELARTNYDSFDFNDGDSVELSFWTVGNSLHCRVQSGEHTVTAHAYNSDFPSGTIALSTLNLFGQYDSVRVCRADATP